MLRDVSNGNRARVAAFALIHPSADNRNSQKFGSEVPEDVAWIDEKACKSETMLW
jgi:hypothetical protein